MYFVSSARGPRHSLVAILGIVCIALVLLTGLVQVTHSHANGHIDHDCALCMTAHSVVQIVVAVTVALTSQPVTHRLPDRFAPLPRQQFVVKLANRPPPAEPAFA